MAYKMNGPSLYKKPGAPNVKDGSYKQKFEKSGPPVKSGLGATAAKEFDVDDLADLKEQNKAKAAEFLKEYRAGKISAKEYHQRVDEMKTYENPE